MTIKFLELDTLEGSNIFFQRDYETSSSGTTCFSYGYGNILPNPIVESKQQVFEILQNLILFKMRLLLKIPFQILF